MQEYKEYQDAWYILYNLENHVNWEQKKLNDNWQQEIVYQICISGYPYSYWNSCADKYPGKYS